VWLAAQARYSGSGWISTSTRGPFWIGNIVVRVDRRPERREYLVRRLPWSVTVLLPNGTILATFSTGFSNTPDAEWCTTDVAMVKWRTEPKR
jgi:hypothetical protein